MSMRRSVLVILLLLAIVPGSDAAEKKRGLEIRWVDTEGGAATLIVTPAGESILIDCGNPGSRDANRIHETAKKAGLKAIDHLIITHWHTDHYGGTEKLAKLIPIKNFYDHGIPEKLSEDPVNFPTLIRAYKNASGGKSKALKPGDEVKVMQVAESPAVKLLCICGKGELIAAPRNAKDNALTKEHKAKAPDPTDNARSLGFILSFGEWRFLDLGDLTWNVEATLVTPQDRIGTVDVYQVTHHGLDSSNNPVLIKTVNPRVAICNNGPRKGGHPTVLQTLKRLPDMQGLFQLHRNLGATEMENTTPDRIANDSRKKEAGLGILLAVEPDAKSYTVTLEKTGKAFKFQTRTAKDSR